MLGTQESDHDPADTQSEPQRDVLSIVPTDIITPPYVRFHTTSEGEGSMEEQLDRVVSSSTPAGAAEELRADLVREMVARAQRGEGAKRIARELGVDRKTVKRWLRLGPGSRAVINHGHGRSMVSSNSSSSADPRWAGTAWCC